MNSRKEFYPDFYKKFKCSAALCDDTCCKDWDVVIDYETYRFYLEMPGQFGEKLKKSMKIDEDGDRIFNFENGVCPFFNSERLCEIQLRFGIEHICETCRTFPRISLDYTEFVEYMLSLACPEACRLVLNGSNEFNFSDNFTVEKSDNGYSNLFMNFLLKARVLTVNIFKNSSVSFRSRLKECISFTEYVQTLIDNDIFEESRLDDFKYNIPTDSRPGRQFVFDMYKNLDIMDKSWLEVLHSSSGYDLNDTYETDAEFTQLALYYIYRYYLSAIQSYDIITTVKRLYCAYIICSSIISRFGMEKDFDSRILIIQKYSKEVEHSFENISFLTDEFVINPDFSAENLLKII